MEFIDVAHEGNDTAPGRTTPQPGDDEGGAHSMPAEAPPAAQPLPEQVPHPSSEGPTATEVAVEHLAAESTPMATSSNEIVEPLPDRLGALERDVADLLTTTSTFKARAEFYEDLVRKQQQRLESLQADQIQTLLGPVLQGLASLLTKADNAADRAMVRGDDAQVIDDFRYFHDAVEEALALVGVNSVGAELGSPFNRAVHAARRSVATDDESLGGTIASVMRQGLIREGADRAFVPAQVSVYRYQTSGPGDTNSRLAPTNASDATQQGENT